MKDKIENIISYWNDGIITKGELSSMLLNAIENISSKEMIDLLPSDLKEELFETCKSIINTPPNKLIIIESVCVADVESYQKSKEKRIQKLNNLRPWMKEYISLYENMTDT